ALQHVENMKVSDHPCINNTKLDTTGKCKLPDLPAQFATERGRMAQYFVDYLLGDYEGDVPWGALYDCAKKCDFKGMPEPFSPKEEPPGQCTTQIFVVKKSDGKHGILKDANLLGIPTKTLEGDQLRCHAVALEPGKGQSRKTVERGSRPRGPQFTREKGPRTNNPNQCVVFADRKSGRPESPISGRGESRVEGALNNYARGKANVKGLAAWALALRDFDPWLLNNAIRPPILVHTLRGFGRARIGTTRVGKSEGSKTSAFMMSRVEIEAPQQSGGVEAGERAPTSVTAKHFDFLKAKAEPVTHVTRNRRFEAELVSQWKMGTLRDVSSDDFMRLIRPSFRHVEEHEDMLAVAARARSALATKKAGALPPRERESRAPWRARTNQRKPDLFSLKCTEASGKRKKDPTQPVYPDYLEEDVKWSMNYLKRLLQNKDAPLAPTVTGAGILTAAPAPSSPKGVDDEWGAHLLGAVASSSSGLSDAVAAASRGPASRLSDVDKGEQKAVHSAIHRDFWQRRAKVSGAPADSSQSAR
ncbi:unnamed protein product, partial [Prorocentrum cordatum]